MWVPERPPKKELTKRLEQRAQRAYGEASRAYQRRRYDAALQHADAAYRAVPNSSTALIRATVLAALSRDADAFDAYLLALDLDPTKEEAELASTGLARHGAVIGRGWAVLSPKPKTADIEVPGGSWQGRRAVGLAPGRYVATVRAEGKAPARVELVVEAGKGVVRDVKLAKPRPGGLAGGPGGGDPDDPWAALVPPVDDDDDGGGSFPTGLVLAVGGGVLMAVGAGTHIAAAGAASDADAAARGDAGSDDVARRARYDDAVDRKDSLETATWVLYAVGAGLLVTGVVLVASEDDEPAAEVVPVVGLDGGGASLRLGF
ncbi:MAG: tetratricopeptide repeat protein [Deltaproteobacteria bacterium]|nr:tetratricopeptide repeat protein [Deltaproteobacteria bacterium]